MISLASSLLLAFTVGGSLDATEGDSASCFNPAPYYRASPTGEVVAVSVAGGYMVATRYGRMLPDRVEMASSDRGNWSLALGRIGCRTITMFEGFRDVAKVRDDGTLVWQSPNDIWVPVTSLTWLEWMLNLFGTTNPREPHVGIPATERFSDDLALDYLSWFTEESQNSEEEGDADPMEVWE